MIISIDESGSFATSPTIGSWNVIAAYVMSERSQTGARHALSTLKKSNGFGDGQEVKLGSISEPSYLEFLFALTKLSGCLFGSVTDAGRNLDPVVIAHREDQAERIRKNLPKMLYEGGKQSVAHLADAVDSLSPQLYVQLQCQVRLVHDIIYRGILYYVQRDPQTLRRFKWRIDQKTNSEATFERTFSTIVPAVLQTISLRDPLPFLEEADYSFFKPFEYEEGQAPTYLSETYGIAIGDGINIGKIMRDDFSFEDSRKDTGIQIADLLASGLRRCLRRRFANNGLAAAMLGSLMISNRLGRLPIQLLGFQDTEDKVSEDVAAAIKIMRRHCRRILVR